MTIPNLRCRFFYNLDVDASISKENVPIEIFNISFESSQNKQQVRGISYGELNFIYFILFIFWGGGTVADI